VSTVRTTVRGLGELLITAGVVLLLFCVYQLVWTNFEADRRADHIVSDLRDEWSRPPTSGGGAGAAQAEPARLGEGFAILHVPRLAHDRDSYSVPVVEGVDLADLAQGVGHYPGTALPGQVGNFAVAGHRATNGEPFRDLDRMRPGDRVIVETRYSWFTYVVDRTRIVSPDAVWVVEPVPGRPNATPTERLMTLTTCNPRWASTERLIVFGHLQDRRAKADGRPPALAIGGS
jgi:sortase A